MRLRERLLDTRAAGKAAMVLVLACTVLAMTAMEQEVESLRVRLRAVVDAPDEESFQLAYAELLSERGVQPVVLHGERVVIGNGVMLLVDRSRESGGWDFQWGFSERAQLPAGPWVRFVSGGTEGLSETPPEDGQPGFVVLASPDALAIVSLRDAMMRRIRR